MRFTHIISLAMVGSLAGCATSCTTPIDTGSVPSVVEVRTPVLYCPAPPAMSSAEYMINTLTDNDRTNPGRVVQMYVASLAQCKGEVAKRDVVIRAYERIQQLDKSSSVIDVNRVFSDAIKE